MSLAKASVVLVSLSFAAAAQDSAAPALEALLKEVRQLRVALERSNLLGPRIQIAMSRIQLQQEQVTRVARQLEETRRDLTSLQGQQAEMAEQTKATEARINESQDLKERATLERAVEQGRSQLERVKAMDQQLRARDGELSSQLMAEQSRLAELNDRIVSIERALENGLAQIK
jgi:chromosome segregation ATPase